MSYIQVKRIITNLLLLLFVLSSGRRSKQCLEGRGQERDREREGEKVTRNNNYLPNFPDIRYCLDKPLSQGPPGHG